MCHKTLKFSRYRYKLTDLLMNFEIFSVTMVTFFCFCFEKSQRIRYRNPSIMLWLFSIFGCHFHRFSNGSSRFWCSFMDWLRCRNGFAGIPKLWRSRLTILSGFWGPEPSRKDWLMRSTFVLAIWIPANFLLDNLWPISGWRTSGYWITFWKYLKLPSSKLMWHYAILIHRLFLVKHIFVFSCLITQGHLESTDS